MFRRPRPSLPRFAQLGIAQHVRQMKPVVKGAVGVLVAAAVGASIATYFSITHSELEDAKGEFASLYSSEITQVWVTVG